MGTGGRVLPAGSVGSQHSAAQGTFCGTTSASLPLAMPPPLLKLHGKPAFAMHAGGVLGMRRQRLGITPFKFLCVHACTHTLCSMHAGGVTGRRAA